MTSPNNSIDAREELRQRLRYDGAVSTEPYIRDAPQSFIIQIREDRLLALIDQYANDRVKQEAVKYCDDGHYHDTDRDVAMLPSERSEELNKEQTDE